MGIGRMRGLGLGVAAALFLAAGGASGGGIDFPNFSNLAPFTRNGSTATIHAGGPILYNGQNVLRLTNAVSQAGSAFLTNPVALGSGGSFSTRFSFQISNSGGFGDGDGPGADGLAFVLQAQGNTALGSGGGGIGYVGITPSLTIEFDTWNNGAPDGNSGNQVGVNLNGSQASVALAAVTRRFNDGGIWYVWVDYNGATDTLAVRVSQVADRPAAALLSYNLDLAALLGGTNAYAGFTSGTGAAFGWHDIRDWRLDPSYAPIGSYEPRRIKQSAVAALQTRLPSGDRIVDNRLAAGVAFIQASLLASLWQDDSHLSLRGKRVFDAESDAVMALHWILANSDADPAIQALARAVRIALAAADESLALTALAEAIAGAGPGKKPQSKLAEAGDSYNDGLKQLLKGDLVQAIAAFRKSWVNSQEALGRKPK